MRDIYSRGTTTACVLITIGLTSNFTWRIFGICAKFLRSAMPADCSKEIYSSIEHLTRLNLIEETENGGFAIKNDRVRGVGASILAVGPRNISRTGIGEFLSDGDVIVRLSGASNLLGAAIEVFSDEQSGLSHLEPALTSTPRRGLKSLVTALLGLR